MAVRSSRGRYVVEFQQGGERVFKRLPPGATRAQAQEWETMRRRQILDGELGKREALTLEGAIGLWLEGNRRKNQRQAESEARQWAPFVKGKMLSEAPEVAATAMAKWCGRTGLASKVRGSSTTAASTINRRLAMLKAVCKHAWRQGLIDQNLSGRIPLLREDNKREVYLTRQETRKLASAAPSAVCRDAILLLAYTGLRVSELLALPQLPSGAATLSVAKSKTGAPRLLPVPPVVRPLLRSLPLGLSYWQLRNEFDAAKVKAGLPHIRIHDLRHTTASWLIQSGVDLYTVGKILGHSGPQTTSRYAHLSTQTLEKAMRRLR